MSKRLKGFSLIELLTALGAVSLLFALGIPGISGFLNRMEIQSGLRSVTSSISQARYSSIKMNRRIKYSIEGNSIRLRYESKGEWKILKEFRIKGEIHIRINSTPVFYPTGRVSPLCSIYVSNSSFLYKITISIAGRIKILKM